MDFFCLIALGVAAVFGFVKSEEDKEKKRLEKIEQDRFDRMYPKPVPPPSRQERLDAAIKDYNAAMKKAKEINDAEMRSEFISAAEIRLRQAMMQE